MSTYHALVLNNVCRSNHHRIAVMALEHLKSDNQEGWRDLFLKHHGTFLEGAKAPDEEFKDFKNHVCHPEDNFWGGAPQAAAEWYRRTVRALQQEDWEHAAWNAGVMSHYLVDPCQPFHTGQSEAEGVIHRAAEYAFSKAFPEIRLIIEQHVKWPDVSVPSYPDWVEEMVRQAATNSHQYYHPMIDHFDMEASRKKPEAGLDQELKDIVAKQLAYATVMLARVMDKAIAESKAEAPKVGLVLSTLLVGIKKPMHVVMKKLDHKEDRKVVAEQYEEFRRTGKVRHTLGDDDKLVRALHAEEVTERHISNIDAEWPRELGTVHGTGAEPRVHKKLKKVKTPKLAKNMKDGETEARSETEAYYDKAGPKAARAAEKAAEKAAAAAAKASALADKQAAKHRAQKQAKADEPAAAKPAVAKAAPVPEVGQGSRIRLTRDAAIVDAPSIGPKTAGKLTVIGIKTVGDLLSLSPEDAARQMKQSHINPRQIKDWQAQALLACSVPDISGTSAQLLVGAGVTSVEDLATSDIDALTDAIKLFVNTPDGSHILRSGKIPDRTRIKGWVTSALEICEQGKAA